MTKVTDEREAFEKWAVSKGMKLTVCPEFPGEYDWPGVQGRWECWQAALSHQGRVVSVEELNGLCDEWENMKVPRSASSYELGNFDGYRGAMNDLRALIGEEHG